MENTKLYSEILKAITEEGMDVVPQVMTHLFNAAMLAERTSTIGAEHYERSENRKGYANGFKPKSMNTRFGKIKLSIPQTRNLEFYPQCLEKGERSEKALKVAIAEMYLNGVSTRRVTEITEALCGVEISSTQVSNITKALDEEFIKFRQRRLPLFVYVTVDAKYEKVRVDKQVVSQCLLVAVGVREDGYREVLAVAVKNSEARVNWKEFLEDIKQRGVTTARMFTSDDHSGLREALKDVYPDVPWQRCQFHFSQNAQHKAKTAAQKTEIAEAVRAIFNQTTIENAQTTADSIVEQFRKRNPDFAVWLESNIHECLAIYSQPEKLRRQLRTSNGLERVNREINRRTSIVGIFPNSDALLRLASGILIEIHENWITAPQPYMKLINHEQTTQV